MTGIDPRHDAHELRQRYALARPFPHVVIDGFLDRDSAEAVARELEATDTTWWHRDDHPDQVAKQWMDDPSRLPPSTAEALRFMNSPSACDFLSVLTGIGDLRPDDSYLGGGVHVTSRGGRLGVHSDFNIHPQSKLHRRVNALLFLNRDWDPLWQGQLELWSKTLDEVSVSVDPNLNRLVVFTITDDAFHGVPTPLACPPDRHRFSLALYYYTADRPEHEKAPFHWAAWQAVART